MVVTSRERSGLHVTIGLNHRLMEYEEEARASILKKLSHKHLSVKTFPDDVLVSSLIGLTQQKDMERQDTPFVNEYTYEFRRFLKDRKIDDNERKVVERVIHRLAFPWQGDRPTGNYFVTMGDVRKWLTSEVESVRELNGFEDDFNLRVAQILFV